MSLYPSDYELLLLQALVELGRSANTSGVYPVVERIMGTAVRQTSRGTKREMLRSAKSNRQEELSVEEINLPHQKGASGR